MKNHKTNPVAAPSTRSEGEVLGSAVINAASILGLTRVELAEVLNRSRTRLESIPPKSNSGQLAMYLVRIYLALHRNVGGDHELIKLWMLGKNEGTGGIPKEQIKEIAGLITVLKYLEFFSNHV